MKEDKKMYSESWKDCLARWIVDKLPKRVIYFAIIRAWAWATTGEWGAEDATAVLVSKVARRWEKYTYCMEVTDD